MNHRRAGAARASHEVQVAAEIRRAIASGEARPGERLPPARDLAAIIGVNINTVLRAPQTLRDEGLLEFRRRTRHDRGGEPLIEWLTTRASDLLACAGRHGCGRGDLIQLVDELS